MAGITYIFIFLAINTAWSNGVLVKVEQGWLSGELKTSVVGDTQYYSFKGIPYAKPPVGPLRFKAPEAPEPWTGVRDATKHGSVCHQLHLINEEVVGNEDCLFLNVYSPCLSPNKPMSVMFFIHGGSFKFGSGDDDIYGADFLVEKGIVLVTINYRLDVLGFLNLNIKDVPGNAGLKDQNAALKWVNRNIKHFGGDPNSVTIFGESAGGASVAYHIASPMSKGLFIRGILQSGVPSLDCLIPYKSEIRSFTLGKSLGFETRDVNELHRFLLEVPKEKLVDTQNTIFAGEEMTSTNFRFQYIAPVIEKDLGHERFVTEDPIVSLTRGNIHNVDVMFGYNSAESVVMLHQLVDKSLILRYNRYQEMFVPSKICIRSTSDTIWALSNKIIDHYFGKDFVNVTNIQKFVNYANFAYIVTDVHRYFDKYPLVAKNNTFCYKLNALSARNHFGNKGAQYGIYGAAHFDDVFYLFHSKSMEFPPLTKDSKELKIIDLITTVFTNFAKYGNPTPDESLGITWPQYDPINRAYVEMTENLTIGYAPDEEEIQFWRSIYEDANVEF